MKHDSEVEAVCTRTWCGSKQVIYIAQRVESLLYAAVSVVEFPDVRNVTVPTTATIAADNSYVDPILC